MLKYFLSPISTNVFIFQAGEGQAGTDECEINSVLCQRTLPQLQATLVAYQELTGNDLRESIESETSGAVQDGYLAIREYCTLIT